MRPQAILLVTLAVLGVLAVALGEGSSSSPWPCCDNCGVCNRKQPPECQCKDVSVFGCHPECKNCVKVGAGIPPGEGPGPVITYCCADVLTNFCQRNCTAAPAAAALGGGAF